MGNTIQNQTEAAINQMLREFSWNTWFLTNHWPENEARVRRMLKDLVDDYPDRDASVLDVGCFVGHISLLIRLMGFETTGADAVRFPEREIAFSKYGIHELHTNLDHEFPFQRVPSCAFDAIVAGEIFEHILNHPLGVLKEFSRILKPRGKLILTTPNPSTAMNAVRVLLDKETGWGTIPFAEVPKITEGRVGCAAHIHFREYRTSDLVSLLENAGFVIRNIAYLPMGSSSMQSPFKKFVKSSRLLRGFLRKRLFAATQYIVAVNNLKA
jgi:2-polyprenyl-3-methyl-5-hydroxy-6-metoxy-1,4-benzoquinol methylase